MFIFDRGDPHLLGLVQATDGNLYGTTQLPDGPIFKISPSGILTTLHDFCLDGSCLDGYYPHAALIQGSDGNFYGTAGSGGTIDAGTIFKMSSSGTLTTLHSFDGVDGEYPLAPLVQATDGNFYGTASGGGPDGYGTVFKVAPSGILTTLQNFDSTDGSSPTAGLVQATSGNFYGTTNLGGTSSVCFLGCGTVFSLDVGLGPQAQIANLQNRVKARVSAGTLNVGLSQLLLAPLNESLVALDTGQATAAILDLNNFIFTIRFLAIVRQLTPAEGNALIDAANSIITALGGKAREKQRRGDLVYRRQTVADCSKLLDATVARPELSRHKGSSFDEVARVHSGASSPG